MAIDLYIYNGGKQSIDTTSSILDLMLQSNVVVTPGSQAHIQVQDQASYSALVAQIEKYGAVDHATVAAPSAFTGVSYSAAPIANIPKKVIPVVQVPVVAKPKGK